MSANLLSSVCVDVYHPMYMRLLGSMLARCSQKKDTLLLYGFVSYNDLLVSHYW